jgi:hypothetical protein
MLSYRSTHRKNLDFFLGPLTTKYCFISTDPSEFNEIFKMPEKIEPGEKFSFKLGNYWLHSFCVSDENKSKIVRFFEFPCLLDGASNYHIGLVMSKFGYDIFMSDVKRCLYEGLSGEFSYDRFPYIHSRSIIIEFSIVTKESYDYNFEFRKSLVEDDYALLATAPDFSDFAENIDTIFDICVESKILIKKKEKGRGVSPQNTGKRGQPTEYGLFR